MTAGKKLAPAVPELQTTATGVLEDWAKPREKNAADRSSRCAHDVIDEFLAKATAMGVERDPGQMETCFNPHFASISTKASAKI